MDEAAPITWLVGRINQIVSSGAGTAAASIAGTITPLVSVCFGIYILLITVNYLRGAESEPIIDFALRSAAMGLVITVGLNASNYTTVVMPIVTGLGGDLAGAVSGGTVNAGTLDQLALWYFQIIQDGYAAIEGLGPIDTLSANMIMFAKTAVVCVGLIPFLVAATLCIVVADVGSLLIAVVGPLFFAAALFPATRQYFSSWVNSALSYALIPLFVAVIAMISVGISREMLSSGGTLYEASFKSVFLAALGNLTLLFLLKTISALASSLSAGGINAAMPGGVGSLAGGIRNFGVGTAREMRGTGRALMGGYQGVRRGVERLANLRNSIRKAG